MGLRIEDCGAVILAGGESHRMGTSKPLLRIGGETIAARLARQFDGFPELWISANHPEIACDLPGQLVQDLDPGLGPLAGLHAALSATELQFLICVSCDLVFFSRELAAAMLGAYSGTSLALACVDSTGRVHPLCGIYAKAALPVIERRLANGQLRMRACLEELRFQPYQIGPRFADVSLSNVNTPEDFARVLVMKEGEGL